MQIVSRKAVSELGFLGGTEAKIQKLTFSVTVATQLMSVGVIIGSQLQSYCFPVAVAKQVAV